MPQIDFSEVSDGFSPLEEGRYDAVLEKFENKVSKDGNSYVALTFTLTEHEGRKAWVNRSLLPQALWRLKKDLVTLGVDKDDLGGLIDTDEILGSLIGVECALYLKVKEYPKNSGKYSNEVDSILVS